MQPNLAGLGGLEGKPSKKTIETKSNKKTLGGTSKKGKKEEKFDPAILGTIGNVLGGLTSMVGGIVGG